MKKVFLSVVVALILISGKTGAVNAQDGPSLKEIMFGLEADMEEIVRALNSDDFETVEAKAMEIANHDKPPIAERKKIMALLGTEMDAFKKSDQLVHNSAVELAEAAAENDHEKVVERFSVLLGGCVSCHTEYRPKIVEHFRGE